MTLLLLFNQPQASSTGDSSATLAIVGTADGLVLIQGASIGALQLSGAADALVLVQAASQSILALAASGAGAVLVQGATDTSLAVTSSADASAAIQGDSTTAVLVSGTADGTVSDPLPSILGDSDAQLALSGAADGTVADAPLGVGGGGVNPALYFRRPSLPRSMRTTRRRSIIAASAAQLHLVSHAEGVAPIGAAAASVLSLSGSADGNVPPASTEELLAVLLAA